MVVEGVEGVDTASTRVRREAPGVQVAAGREGQGRQTVQMGLLELQIPEVEVVELVRRRIVVK